MNSNAVYLILPNIRSCHNVGAMFRTADAFGVDFVYLCGYTACPPKPQIDKVSLGAELWVPWEHRDNTASLLQELRADGVFVVGLEQTPSSISIETLQLPSRVALVVGNEVNGVSAELLYYCDVVTHIPMQGRKESLNVSIAAGIALYECARQLRI